MSDSFLCPSPCSSYYTLSTAEITYLALWWESILCVASQSLISVCLSSLVVPVSIFLSPFGSLSCFGFYIYSFILFNSDFLMFAFLIYMTLEHMGHTLGSVFGTKSYWFSFSQQLSHSMGSSLIHFYTERKKSSCCAPETCFCTLLLFFFECTMCVWLQLPIQDHDVV